LTGSVQLDDPVGISGHHEDFRARTLCLLYQICTRAIAQYAVCRQQVRNLVLDEFSSRRDRGNGGGTVAGLFELKNELLAKLRLAIDNERTPY
jgi:hypothetical protein